MGGGDVTGLDRDEHPVAVAVGEEETPRPAGVITNGGSVLCNGKTYVFGVTD